MTVALLLLVATGVSWISVGAAIGHVERRGWSLVRFQLLWCAVCVALGIAGWMASPTDFFPQSGCPATTWVLVIAGTLSCGIFNYLMNMMTGRAMKSGPNAVVWAIVQCGLIYPFIMGGLVFGVSMGPRRLCGILLIVASVFMYAAKDNPGVVRSRAAEDVRKRHTANVTSPLRQWLPAALLGMFCCGVNQCGANLPSYLEGGREFSGTFRTMSMYLGLLLAGLVHMAVSHSRDTRLASAKVGEMRGLVVWAVVVGVIAFLTSKYLTFPGLDRLERLGAGSMGYPVAVASCIAGFFPYGVLILHERIGIRQVAGAILSVVGILVGCL